MITQQRLHELFEYRDDGNLIWKVNVNSVARKGNAAGSVDNGYTRISIDYKRYLLHRLIFLYHYGYLTDGLHIDHIDGNPENNRIENLREATQSQNFMNSKKSSNNTSGIKGVYLDRGIWRCAIAVNKKRIYLGSYKTQEEAVAAVKEAREKYHGDFARHY